MYVKDELPIRTQRFPQSVSSRQLKMVPSRVNSNVIAIRIDVGKTNDRAVNEYRFHFSVRHTEALDGVLHCARSIDLLFER